ESPAVLHAASEQNDLQRASQINVEALLFGFAIQRRSTVNEGVGGACKDSIVVLGQAEAFGGQVAAKDVHARSQVIEEFRKIEMKLQGLPQALACFLFGACTHQQV